MPQQTEFLLSVVIVNYNVKYFLEQALLSVRKASAQLPVEVFVVDNNSVDDSVQMVKEKFPEVILIENKENTGFSVANNQAIRISKGKYVLLLNPDTVVKEDTFEKCLNFMETHPDAGALGVKMIDGSGNFLPESKRGFPTPFVAFCKTFGLSSLFPKSKLFNRYHLGYLDKDENHEVDVLSGAFMLMRKEALDKVGLLDETFFMYGEDIDLSYRITLGGYKNYYFSDTTIIHYKGESTKRGSLNYVRTFYNAMIIFARKHFEGEKARLFVFGLQMAIYLRAFMTLMSNLFRRFYLPALDALLLFLGLYLIKDFWASLYYKDPNYYQPTFFLFNVPLYISIWLGSVYFSGGYDAPTNLRRMVRGLLFGTLVLAAIYGFLPLEYRPSRAILLLGAVWAVFSMGMLRTGLHFIRHRNFNVGRQESKNLIIVGSVSERDRVLSLLQKAGVQPNIIGTVSPEQNPDSKEFLSSLDRLDEVVYIYKVDEIIFCGKDVSAKAIMHWMTVLGPEKEYKIVPKESLSIIGSSSKNTAGQLYTVDIQFNIATRMARRNKRVIDLTICGVLFFGVPFLIWFVQPKRNYFRNIFAVLFKQKTWVGYAATQESKADLPAIREGIISPLEALRLQQVDEPTRQRLNFFYAKDYKVVVDLEILLKAFRKLGK